MKNGYEKDYALITGLTDFEEYTTPEEQANKIKKCSLLKRVDITFSDRIIENNNLHSYQQRG